MKKFFAILAAVVSVSAFAQAGGPAVGSLSNVNGLVTITQNDQLISASNGSTFSNGARIVSTATGNVTINVQGCSIDLAPNQAMTVNTASSCQTMQASVANLPPPAGGAAVAAGTGGGYGAGLGVIAFGALAQYKAYKDTPASLR